MSLNINFLNLGVYAKTEKFTENFKEGFIKWTRKNLENYLGIKIISTISFNRFLIVF